MANVRNMYFLEFSEAQLVAEQAAAEKVAAQEDANASTNGTHVVTIDLAKHRVVPTLTTISGQLPDVVRTVVRFREAFALHEAA